MRVPAQLRMQPGIGTRRQIRRHQQRRTAVERKRRHQHPAVPDRHQLRHPRPRLRLQQGNRILTMRSQTRTQRDLNAAPPPAPPAPAPPAPPHSNAAPPWAMPLARVGSTAASAPASREHPLYRPSLDSSHSSSRLNKVGRAGPREMVPLAPSIRACTRDHLKSALGRLVVARLGREPAAVDSLRPAFPLLVSRRSDCRSTRSHRTRHATDQAAEGHHPLWMIGTAPLGTAVPTTTSASNAAATGQTLLDMLQLLARKTDR